MTTKPLPTPDPKAAAAWFAACARAAGHRAGLNGRPYKPPRSGTNDEWRAYQDGYAAGQAARDKRRQ